METVKGPDSKETRIERMVNLYQLPLLRLCVMYLRDEEQAKDAVQETFLKAYRNLDGFRGDASEKTWLTRIAINTCKNIRRSGWFRYIDHSVPLDRVAGRSAPASQEDDEITTEILNRGRRDAGDFPAGCRQPVEPCKKKAALCFGRK